MSDMFKKNKKTSSKKTKYENNIQFVDSVIERNDLLYCLHSNKKEDFFRNSDLYKLK